MIMPFLAILVILISILYHVIQTKKMLSDLIDTNMGYSILLDTESQRMQLIRNIAIVGIALVSLLMSGEMLHALTYNAESSTISINK